MSKNYFYKEKKKLTKQTKPVQAFGDVVGTGAGEHLDTVEVPSKSVNSTVTSSAENDLFQKPSNEDECNKPEDVFVLWSDEENSPPKRALQSRSIANEVEQSVEQTKVDISTLLCGEPMPTCPICNKKNTYVQNDALIAHLKSCASKNNLSTDQLIKAVELHQKQANERTALGLPRVQEKTVKRSTTKKGGVDANLELAMALSASLRESEMLHKMRESEILLEAGLEKEALSQCKKLEDFGFAGPPPSTSRNNRKQKNVQNSILFTRSNQERERIITEKVAIILIDADTTCEPTSEIENPRHELQSKFLKKLLDAESTLWKKSHHLDELDGNDSYYCRNLSSFVSPCKLSAGAKLRHISQIPQRLPSQQLPSPRLPSPVGKSTTASENFQVRIDNSKRVAPLSPTNQVSSKMAEYRKLSQTWKSLINKSTLSDVTIYAKNERAIYAHKLVLHVRCPAILTEAIKECANGKCTEMIMWMSYDYETAVVFLEYLYSGDLAGINKLSEKQRTDLKNLSSNYNVDEVWSAVNQLDLAQDEPIVIDSDDNDSPIEIQMTEGEQNLRLLELELKAQTLDSSPIGSPEMFGVIEDESTLDELHLSSSEDDLRSPERVSNEPNVSEKRKSHSPVGESQLKRLKFEDETPSDLEIDFNTPNFSQLSIAFPGGKSCNAQPCEAEPEEPNRMTLTIEDSNSTPDVIDHSNDVCVVETSPYISPVWNGFEDMNYDRIDDFDCLMAPSTPKPNLIERASTSGGGRTNRRSNEPFFDSFDINTSELDRLVDREIAKTQPVLIEGSVTQYTTPLSVRKFKCRSKSDNVLTPNTKSSSDITPMADYSNMKTKELKKELDRYGLKPGLNRSKAKKLLRYIYDELHPYVDDSRPDAGVPSTIVETNSMLRSENGNTLEDKENDSDECSTQSSGVEYLEESFHEDEADIFSQDVKSNTQSSRIGLDVGFRKLLEEDKDLHQKILLYEPIWLEPLRSSLKALNVKFNVNELVNYLDEKCITYRTHQTRSRRKRKRLKAGTATQTSSR